MHRTFRYSKHSGLSSPIVHRLLAALSLTLHHGALVLVSIMLIDHFDHSHCESFNGTLFVFLGEYNGTH